MKIKDLTCIYCRVRSHEGKNGDLWMVKRNDDFYRVRHENITIIPATRCAEMCKSYMVKIIEAKPIVVSNNFISFVLSRKYTFHMKSTKTWEKNLKIYCNKQKDEKIVVKVRNVMGDVYVLEITNMMKVPNGDIQLSVNPIIWQPKQRKEKGGTK